MKSKSQVKKTRPPAKRSALGVVQKKTQKIKATVKEAATKLTTVNKGLRLKKGPVQAINRLLIKNEEAESKVAKAAVDLKQVGAALVKEVSGRKDIEVELADTKTDLAEVRDDLSKSRVKEDDAQQIALQDPLTGLPNRVSLKQRLDHGLIQAKRHGWGLAVLFIDIDKFKNINDSHGHDSGDRALVMVASRLQSCVRDADMVSRWGGDEFVCLLLEVKKDADVVHLAEKMIARIGKAWKINGVSLSIKGSIGIALYPADGKTAGVLLKKADTAMYKAKGTEKRVVLFRNSRE